MTEPTKLQEAVARAMWNRAQRAVRFPRKGVLWESAPGLERTLIEEMAQAAIRAVFDALENPDDEAVAAGDKAMDEYCQSVDAPEDAGMTRVGFQAMTAYIKQRECDE